VAKNKQIAWCQEGEETAELPLICAGLKQRYVGNESQEKGDWF